MSLRRGILAAGTWLVDTIKLLDTFPEQERLCNVLSQTQANGGCPYNVLKDLHKMQCGFPLEAAGVIGNDANGDYIINDCKQHNIDISRMTVLDNEVTSFTDVMTDSQTGKRTFFHCRGCNGLFEPKHVDFSTSNAKIFLEGYMGLHDKMDTCDDSGENGHSTVFRRAKELGFITVGDLVTSNSDFYKIADASLKWLDILSINEIELQMIAGVPVDTSTAKDINKVEYLAKSILDRGLGKFIVVHFPECAIAFDKSGKKYVQPSLNVPQELVVGSVGAGDAFMAGILWAVHEDKSIEEALHVAVRSAAQSLFDSSASGSIVPISESLLLTKKFGFRTI